MFDAQLEVDAFDGTARLRSTHNGMAWTDMELRTPAEAAFLVDLLQEATLGKLFHAQHAWDCSVHDGYLCSCGWPRKQPADDAGKE